MSEMPSFDVQKCQGCQLCVSVCQRGGLRSAGESIEVVRVDDCDGCGQCELVCPTGAISFPFEVVIEELHD